MYENLLILSTSCKLTLIAEIIPVRNKNEQSPKRVENVAETMPSHPSITPMKGIKSFSRDFKKLFIKILPPVSKWKQKQHFFGSETIFRSNSLKLIF